VTISFRNTKTSVSTWQLRLFKQADNHLFIQAKPKKNTHTHSLWTAFSLIVPMSDDRFPNKLVGSLAFDKATCCKTNWFAGNFVFDHFLYQRKPFYQRSNCNIMKVLSSKTVDFDSCWFVNLIGVRIDGNPCLWLQQCLLLIFLIAITILGTGLLTVVVL
jgi:hypothetical protein